MLKKRLGVEGIERDWTWRKNLMNYFKIPTNLIIPESCVRIGYHAFDCYSYRNLREVVIPKSIKYIGSSAFYYCKELEEVIIPESVERIGYEAFFGCDNATITLKKPMSEFKSIGVDAFKNCKDVKEEIRN